MKKAFYQSTAFALSAVLTWSVCHTDVFAAEQNAGEINFSYVYMEDKQVGVSENQNILIQLQETQEKPISATIQYHIQGDAKSKNAEAVKISDHALFFTVPSGADEAVVVLEQVEWNTEQGAYAIHFTEDKTTYQISKKNETDDAVLYFADGQSMTTSPVKITIQDDMKETIAIIQETVKNLQDNPKTQQNQNTTNQSTTEHQPTPDSKKPQFKENETAHTGGELFRDVTPQNWYYSAVSFVMNKGLMSGLADGNFGVGKTINRAQLLTTLYRMAGSPAVGATSVYTDVPADAFYAKAATWAGQEGLLFAKNTNTLNPLEEVTKEELIFTLYRYAQNKGLCQQTAYTETLQFQDANQISPSAKEAMTWAVSAGLIHGNENHLLQPQEKTSRAVCASMISRFCDLYLPNQYPNIPIYAKAGQIALTENDKQAGTFTIMVSDMQASTEVSMIEAQVWSATDGSDKHTYVGEKQNNQFVVEGNIQHHKFHTGTYHVTIYGVLSNGIRINAGTQTMTVEGDEAQVRIQKHVNQVYQQTGKDLYACYQWVVKNMKYKKMPIPTQPPAGYTKEQWNAVVAFEQHQGNCFNFAAAFYELAKGLGYDARYVEGAVPLARGGRGPHGWVEITKDRAVYICDPDLQYEIKGRNFYMQPVGKTVVRYYR